MTRTRAVSKIIDEEGGERAEPRHGRDPSGGYDYCAKRISPEGHKPLASCHLKVWVHVKHPIGWGHGFADADDHSKPHSCREWTPEEDARIRRLMEETARQRYGQGWEGTLSRASHGRQPDAKTDSPRQPRPSGKTRPPRSPRAAATVTLQGEPADASLRTARKAHACASCAGEIGPGAQYVESRIGAKSAFEPLRYCVQCSEHLGYKVLGQ